MIRRAKTAKQPGIKNSLLKKGYFNAPIRERASDHGAAAAELRREMVFYVPSVWIENRFRERYPSNNYDSMCA